MAHRYPRVAAAAILLSCVPGFHAASLHAQRRSLVLDDYYRIEQATNPTIAPDGRWVAWVRGALIEAENRRVSEVWLSAADGSGMARRLSDSGATASDPRWSPDGQLLSFSMTRRGGTNGALEAGVWFVRPARPAEGAFRLPGLNEPPVWSPDGRWIAFTRATPPERGPPAAESESERKLRERFTGRASEWMNYRFDGRGYLPDPRDPAATPPREIYLLPAAGGTPRRLTTLGVDARALAWSPDSRRLAFVADRYQRDEHTYERADLFTVALDGQVNRLTDDGHDHGAPAWTPDGAALVFTRQLGLSEVLARGQQHGAPVDLYRMPADGGPLVNLTPEWDLLPGAPMPSPDGRWIYFTAGLGGTSHLVRMPAAGGAVEQVTRGARRLSGFSFSAAWDRMAFAGSDAERPAEIFSADLNGGGERWVTRLNDALLSRVEVRPVTRIEFRSGDGTPLEGWVVTPRGYEESEARFPLVLAIHGGPHAAYGPEFHFGFQYLAANGYLVVYTNPRGSTGYGERFLWATWGGWGNLDGQDVMAGVDHVLAAFRADSTRMGVTGYSYGGFLTNWLITQTTRFRAAVSGAGISNWLSDYATSDIPRTKESEFHGPPWEPRGAETLWRQSPVRLAGRVRTPTLFLHGEADLRVPIEQAEQMYVALQKNRIPSRFVRYPGMYHGGWTPWNTVHRYHEELNWWNRWLRAERVP